MHTHNRKDRTGAKRASGNAAMQILILRSMPAGSSSGKTLHLPTAKAEHQDGVKEVVTSREVVEGTARPLYIHAAHTGASAL
jgi:hypothetical protein